MVKMNYQKTLKDEVNDCFETINRGVLDIKLDEGLEVVLLEK